MEETPEATVNAEPAVETEPAVLITIEIEEIVEAIKIQAQHKGSSRAALLKHFKGKLDLPSVEDLTVPLKKALDAGVKSGILTQDKQSFKVKGVEFPPPKDSTVISEVLQPPEDATSLPVKKGHSVEVAYEGRLLDGTAFDSADRFSFTVGGGEVIKGWDQGVLGMRVGEQRRLTIPPKLGYGKRGSAPEVPPDATIVFDVTLKNLITDD
ncbi:hypothetical protein CEUSTIGMA_g8761.t1 [Chlamydomonas eustigma]|uniref:peptidylprolyl isomerase n=1 Tax=Chlamydomonas eustigma TaxID=1157962 RepID=A0A250XEW9_9CHLO|nr:hypothetical protein CEUSTIGMA_g8761.t1 [Chlamydomonas eustigma]|eukprot:GAX81330.1 hypothetical protein CEUSTIGMA_g8761.t1 [Chlamydomonas eustigma]